MQRKQDVVAFDLPSMGEWQFIGPVVTKYAERNPHAPIVLVHQGDTMQAFRDAHPEIDARCTHVARRTLDRSWRKKGIDLFVTSEQFDRGLDGVYSISIFHGHAAKGLSFVPEVIATFDALFLIGPVHRDAFDVFVKEFLGGTPPRDLELFEIGYPKSDRLLGGGFSREQTMAELALDPSRKTVLYAPAFNEGASLRECGVEIVRTLARQPWNVLVKLPIECWRPTTSHYATGGVDWFARFREIEREHPNVRLYTDYQIDPLLLCADVLITCISSVSFEFLALNRPVVFIDTPKYFREILKQYFPDRDTESWASRTTVNGGREFGLVVSDPRELPAAIDTVLASPNDHPRQQERLQHYLLYNRGRGAEAAAERIEELMRRGARTRRPWLLLRLRRIARALLATR